MLEELLEVLAAVFVSEDDARADLEEFLELLELGMADLGGEG
jgi:hypothetical protein